MAILDQIQRKRWEKITVQDLLDSTGISRSTFYAHYDNKLAVLTDNIPSVAGTVRVDPLTKHVDLAPLFAHVDQMAPIMHPLLSQPVLRDMIDKFEREFASVFAESTSQEGGNLPEFLAGGLIATIRLYAAERHRRPPEEMAAEVGGYINELLNPKPTAASV